MRIVAYLYTDSLLEPVPEPSIWGTEVDTVYQDIGTSQRGDSKRPQLQRLLGELQTLAENSSPTSELPLAYVLVRRLEELGDTIEAVGDCLKTLEMWGVSLVATDGQTRTQVQDLSKADMLQLLQMIQKEQRSRSIRKGHARNRVKAMPPPGRAPYGYRRGKDRYALDRAASTVVKDFFDHFLLYASLRGAVRYIAKKHGKEISVSTGQRWLTNPVYRGDLSYKNGEVVPNTHGAIISRDEAAQVDRLLRRNRRLAPRTASAPRSLAGLVFCGQCQSPTTVSRVMVRGKSQEYLYLRPTACGQNPKCKAISYDPLLQKIIEEICIALPQAVAGVNSSGLDQAKAGLEGAIAAKQQILEQIPDLQTQGILDEETTQLRIYKLRTEIADLRSRLAQMPPVNLRELAQAVAIPQFWIDLSESERRFFFREFIQKIELFKQPQAGKKVEWTVQLRFIF
jgi:DNA invertase Pin-like site-specific DNA recombinase/predicted metal-binding protein